MLHANYCNAGVLEDSKSFVHLLNKDYEPTLSDVYLFFGNEGGEYEMIFEEKECKDKKLLNEDCNKEMTNRHENPDHSKSFFLKWLRSKLPLSPDLTIYEVKRVGVGDSNKRNYYEYELITADLNKTEVIFFRALDPKKTLPYGRIEIKVINGIPLPEIFADDIKKWFSKEERMQYYGDPDMKLYYRGPSNIMKEREIWTKKWENINQIK